MNDLHEDITPKHYLFLRRRSKITRATNDMKVETEKDKQRHHDNDRLSES
jgi:hypothetical protein